MDDDVGDAWGAEVLGYDAPQPAAAVAAPPAPEVDALASAMELLDTSAPTAAASDAAATLVYTPDAAGGLDGASTGAGAAAAAAPPPPAAPAALMDGSALAAAFATVPAEGASGEAGDAAGDDEDDDGASHTSEQSFGGGGDAAPSAGAGATDSAAAGAADTGGEDETGAAADGEGEEGETAGVVVPVADEHYWAAVDAVDPLGLAAASMSALWAVGTPAATTLPGGVHFLEIPAPADDDAGDDSSSGDEDKEEEEKGGNEDDDSDGEAGDGGGGAAAAAAARRRRAARSEAEVAARRVAAYLEHACEALNEALVAAPAAAASAGLVGYDYRVEWEEGGAGGDASPYDGRVLCTTLVEERATGSGGGRQAVAAAAAAAAAGTGSEEDGEAATPAPSFHEETTVVRYVRVKPVAAAVNLTLAEAAWAYNKAGSYELWLVAPPRAAGGTAAVRRIVDLAGALAGSAAGGMPLHLQLVLSPGGGATGGGAHATVGVVAGTRVGGGGGGGGGGGSGGGALPARTSSGRPGAVPGAEEAGVSQETASLAMAEVEELVRTAPDGRVPVAVLAARMAAVLPSLAPDKLGHLILASNSLALDGTHVVATRGGGRGAAAASDASAGGDAADDDDDDDDGDDEAAGPPPEYDWVFDDAMAAQTARVVPPAAVVVIPTPVAVTRPLAPAASSSASVKLPWAPHGRPEVALSAEWCREVVALLRRADGRGLHASAFNILTSVLPQSLLPPTQPFMPYLLRVPGVRLVGHNTVALADAAPPPVSLPPEHRAAAAAAFQAAHAEAAARANSGGGGGGGGGAGTAPTAATPAAAPNPKEDGSEMTFEDYVYAALRSAPNFQLHPPSLALRVPAALRRGFLVNLRRVPGVTVTANDHPAILQPAYR